MIQPIVLVIDNNADFRRQFARYLERRGFQALEAMDPGEANSILRTHLVHLAVVDVRLRNDDDKMDRSGLHLCEQIDPVVARVILTGFPDDWELVRSALGPLEKGHRVANGFLSKLEDPDQVVTVIKQVLEEEFEVLPARRIAVLTSGGDSPGMNAAIRAIVRTAMLNETEVIGVLNGYRGLVEGEVMKLRWNGVNDILTHSGTILGTARYEDFRQASVREAAVENIIRKQITGIIVIGGDGSMQGAAALSDDLAKLGVPLQTVAIPGTIDNDLWGTDMSLGAASAANAMTEILRNMLYPAQALRRVFVCQVMGRYSGFLALEAAIGIGADAVILPEQVVVVKDPKTGSAPSSWKDRVLKNETENRLRAQLSETADHLRSVFAAGKRYAFVVLGEGVAQLTKGKLNGEYVREYLENCTKEWDETYRPDVREHVLGHPVRGVAPSRFDIWLGTRLGSAAVQCLMKRQTNVMVGWVEEKGIVAVPFEEVVTMSNRAPAASWLDRPKWQELLELQQATACPPGLSDQLRASKNQFVAP